MVSPQTTDAIVMSELVMGSCLYCGEMNGPHGVKFGSIMYSSSALVILGEFCVRLAWSKGYSQIDWKHCERYYMRREWMMSILQRKEDFITLPCASRPRCGS